MDLIVINLWSVAQQPGLERYSGEAKWNVRRLCTSSKPECAPKSQVERAPLLSGSGLGLFGGMVAETELNTEKNNIDMGLKKVAKVAGKV